jgi:predicted RNase H-like nuclease (RuvC/YqgF family)
MTQLCVQAQAAEREAEHVSVRDAAFQRIKQAQQHTQELGMHNDRLQGDVQELGERNECLQGDVQDLRTTLAQLQVCTV